jgi:hypothetical protein
VTKEQLIEAVRPGTSAVEESKLTYQIFAIRKALGEAADREKYSRGPCPGKATDSSAPLSAEPAAPSG